MTKFLMFKTNSPLRNEYILGCFEHFEPSNLRFVSDFDIRISDLLNRAGTGSADKLVMIGPVPYHEF